MLRDEQALKAYLRQPVQDRYAFAPFAVPVTVGLGGMTMRCDLCNREYTVSREPPVNYLCPGCWPNEKGAKHDQA